MRTQLLEIQPNELNFIVEANKISSCSIQLTNNSGDHVAFKVKTTSPTKYSVRPNVGLVLPYSTYKFVVTMRAQPTASADMLCTDKFLVQSTIVPATTIEADISSSMFLKDLDKYVEEKRLNVILISPPFSPVLSPINVTQKDADLKRQRGGLKGAYYGISDVKNQLKTEVYIADTQKAVVNEFTAIIEEDSKPEKMTEKILKESTVVNEDDSKPVKVIEMIAEDTTVINEDRSKPMNATGRDVEDSKVFNEDESKPMNATGRDVEDSKVFNEDESKPTKATERDVEESKVINEDVSKPMKVTERVVESAERNEDELTPGKGIERVVESSEIKKMTELEKEKEITAGKDEEMLKLVEDITDMKSNLVEFELKLNKAQNTISELTESGQITIRQMEVLQKRLAELSKRGDRRAQVGFSLLFACMIVVISIILGNFLLHR